MDNRRFEFILFDLIGTTVRDSHQGDSFIIDAFRTSFRENGYDIEYDQINLQRGKSKKEAIQNILGFNHAADTITNKIYDDFMNLLNKSLCNFVEIEGAKNLFGVLQSKGIRVGIGSGLPLAYMHGIIKQVGWQHIQFDYIGSSAELGKGRPDPVMISDALKKSGIRNKLKVLKIGDTIADIQEGKNAGVQTAAVLTGTQTREMLEKSFPGFIFADINGILTIL